MDAGPSNTFDLTLTEYVTEAGVQRPARTETHRGLSMSATSPREVEKVVNEESDLVTVARGTAANVGPPLQNGTVSGAFTGTPPLVSFTGTATARSADVTIGQTTARAEFERPQGATTLPPAAVARLLETAIRTARPADPAFAGASVGVVGDNRLRVLAGPGAPAAAQVAFAATTTAPADTNTVTDLKLTAAAGATANVQEYALGLTQAVQNTAQAQGAAGGDGLPPNGQALIGSENLKTGIHALENVDLFNILCLPRAALDGGPAAGELTPTEAQAVMSVAEAYCARRRAFFLVDAPNGEEEPEEIKTWLAANDSLRDRNAALYYPRLKIPDPLNEFRPRSVGASGTIAGLYARTDNERGVWKAPAGTDATLRGVSELEYRLTDPQNGSLNPLAVNCLRTFPIYGTVCWGARTLDGSDQEGSEWKYVPVRRLALMIEESLYRGTKWVVFEPNDEALWAQIRLNVGAFMQNLFRQGAFQGTSPREAYFVKCDKETTTQNDINPSASRADFALTAKTTRVELDYNRHLSWFGLRDTVVYARSEPLKIAEYPLTEPVRGNEVVLDRRVEGLVEGRTLIFSGEDETGAPAGETATLKVATHEGGHTTLRLAAELAHAYRRDTLEIRANVARATHGETRHEVLGGGDASTPFQGFALREAPLTHTSAPTPSGTESSLEVRVNDVAWREVPDLYGHGPDERVFVSRVDEAGGTKVRFGDGRAGARLPTGTENVRATYRKGTGSAGLVRAGQLSLLMTSVLGVRGVGNPLAPTGAEDPEPQEEARRNAPLTVLTLDRAVSLRDYEDFARAYAGVAKALAAWTWTGETREVFVTVAGPGGRPVGADLLENLTEAIRASGDRRLALRVEEYDPASFGVAAGVRVDPDRLPERVVEGVAAALRGRFGFEARSFGQGVALSEVVAVMQAVPGVTMVDVNALYRLPRDGRDDRPQPFLVARSPRPGQQGAVPPAELLTLDPNELGLEVLP